MPAARQIKNKNSAAEADKYWTSKQWEQFQSIAFKHSPACKKTVQPLGWPNNFSWQNLEKKLVWLFFAQCSVNTVPRGISQK
jgi:hypothetical protein